MGRVETPDSQLRAILKRPSPTGLNASGGVPSRKTTGQKTTDVFTEPGNHLVCVCACARQRESWIRPERCREWL